MLRTLLVLAPLALTSWAPTAPPDRGPAPEASGECPGPSTVYGKIEVVESFADCKIKVVDSFEDLRVKVVTSFADDPGEWQMVESFPDYTVTFVDSFEDFSIEYVESFPGVDR